MTKSNYIEYKRELSDNVSMPCARPLSEGTGVELGVQSGVESGVESDMALQVMRLLVASNHPKQTRQSSARYCLTEKGREAAFLASLKPEG